MKTEIFIVVRGGTVQSVYSNEEEYGVDIYVLDMDDIESQPEDKDREDRIKELLASVNKVY